MLIITNGKRVKKQKTYMCAFIGTCLIAANTFHNRNDGLVQLAIYISYYKWLKTQVYFKIILYNIRKETTNKIVQWHLSVIICAKLTGSWQLDLPQSFRQSYACELLGERWQW